MFVSVAKDLHACAGLEHLFPVHNIMTKNSNIYHFNIFFALNGRYFKLTSTHVIAKNHLLSETLWICFECYERDREEKFLIVFQTGSKQRHMFLKMTAKNISRIFKFHKQSYRIISVFLQKPLQYKTMSLKSSLHNMTVIGTGIALVKLPWISRVQCKTEDAMMVN